MKKIFLLFAAAVTVLSSCVKENGLEPMKYNIEIKSSDGSGEGVDWPEYKQFVDVCAPVLQSCNLGDRLIIQSFDDRALNYLNEKYRLQYEHF